MLERIVNFCRPKDRSAAREHYARGTALYEQGQYEDAAACLNQVRGGADVVSRMARYYEGMSHRALGISDLAEGRFARAEGHLRTASELLGEAGDLTSYLASLYAQTGRFGQCASELEKAPPPAENAAGAARKLAQAQWHAGRREQAMLTLTEAMRTVGPEACLHLQLGLFHAAREDYAQAIESLTRASQADCTSAKTPQWLGLAAVAGGNLRLAIRSLQRALQLRPTDVMLAYQLATVARTAAGEGFRVVVQLPENLTTQPSSTLAEQLAKFITNEKEFVEAFLSLPVSEVDHELFGTLASIVQTALAQNENYADLRYIAAAVRQRLGQLDLATEHAQAAVRINPRYVNARVLLADLLCAQGRRTEAIGQLQAAIRFGADWPDIHCRAGQLMFANNLPEQAREHFQRALQLNASYRPAATALAAWAA
jgi:tetratricopeptide (TPR) repeat protein